MPVSLAVQGMECGTFRKEQRDWQQRNWLLFFFSATESTVQRQEAVLEQREKPANGWD